MRLERAALRMLVDRPGGPAALAAAAAVRSSAILDGVMTSPGEGAAVPAPATTASTLAELVTARRHWRQAQLELVMTNGCYDLLHPGHVALLEAARAEGDVLVVALNSDDSVRRIKGAGRPILPQAERAELLLALESVDRVVVYDEDTPLEVVKALLPDVLVKGADWAAEAIVGRAEVEAAGGRVVRVELVAGRSTSSIVERIRRS
jgi:D-beta-D-heptose 7-phosphate kinase/D-beta-D-heptose 1-phosphate adenosyltransferase